jgi:sugar phosphate permease
MRPAGILGAIGAIALASALLVLMVWLLGEPSLVQWWRSEYLMAGFIAMLVSAVLLARRSRKPKAEPAQGVGQAGRALAKGLGIVFGAILLLLLFQFLTRTF